MQRATVTYAGGQISIAAANSSLNQILREIAQQTGMKITGGVTDERVFGNYGPAAPAIVLAQLLNGTGSNMLLVQSATAVPTELILTPRNGGPTPPNPNASGFENENNNARSPIGRRQPPQGRIGNSNPLNPGNNGNNVPTAIPSPAQPSAGTTTQQSPNGVKTPQQIYDQLQQMQQQQQPGTPPQTAPAP